MFFNWITLPYLLINPVLIPLSIARSETILVQEVSDPNYQKLVQYAQNTQLDRLAMADIIQNIAAQFLGAKYQAGLLDRSPTEKLFISLKEFDCVLFVETVLALSHNFALKNYQYSAFSQQVLNQRYRHGILDGYCSRLHYFSDWINDNQKRGNLENLTHKLGGITLDKKLNFISKNRHLYPQLKTQSNYDCIQQLERQLESLSLTYIPTPKINVDLKLRAVGDGTQCHNTPVMGKHPDFMVAHPTPTIFRPLVEIFEISYFFAKNFEKVYTKTSTRRPTFGRNLPKVVNFGEKKTSRP